MKVGSTFESGAQMTEVLFTMNAKSSQWNEVTSNVCPYPETLDPSVYWKVSISCLCSLVWLNINW